MLLFDEEHIVFHFEEEKGKKEEKNVCFCASIGCRHFFVACLSTNPFERGKKRTTSKGGERVEEKKNADEKERNQPTR